MYEALEEASFYKFRSFDDFRQLIEALPSKLNIPSELIRTGESVRGRPIYCLRLGEGGAERPGVLYMSLTHGLEFIGGDMNLEILRWFAGAGDRRKIERILERCDVYIVPAVNPDGYHRAASRKGTPATAFGRKNENRVDLNRNFSVGFDNAEKGIWVGMPVRFMPFYRGPEPFSEPESRAIRYLVKTYPVRTSLSFHSCGRAIGYPYCFKPDKCRDHETLHSIAMEMRARQKRVKYSVMQEYDYIPTSGDMDDWLYERGGVLPFLMELGKPGLSLDRPHTWLNPFSWVNMKRYGREIRNVLPGVLYLAEWTAKNAE